MCLEVPLDSKLTSQQCTTAAMKANQILDCICRGIASRERDVIISLYSSLVTLHLEYCVPTSQKRHRETGKGPKEGHKHDHKLKILPYEERLKELNLSLEKRRLRDDIIIAFQYLKDSLKRMESLSSQGDI